MIYQLVYHYSSNKNITSMIRSDLCDYSDAYIVVKGGINLLTTAANENDKDEKNVAFKIMLHLDHAFQKLTVH